MGNKSMTRAVILSMLVCKVFSAVVAAAGEQAAQEPRQKTAPVALSARRLQTAPKARQTIEFTLKIGKEFEIYSERTHELFRPLKAELLDAKLQPIRSTMTYPQPKRISVNKDPGGDYDVYHGKARFAATCASGEQPAYVRVSYAGYSNRGY